MKQMLHTKALIVKESVGATQPGVIDQITGSTQVLDRMGDIIDQSGWDLKDFNNNPVILWGHNMGEERLPIGRAIKTWVQDKGKETAKLMFKVQFDLADPFAAEVYRKIKDNFLNTVSVGFLPTEYEELDPGNWWGGLKFLKQQLLELSVVCVPANPQALMPLKSFGKEDKRFIPIAENKLFAPIKNEDDLEKILSGAKVIKAVDDNNADNIDSKEDGTTRKPDGSYDETTLVSDLTVGEYRKEMKGAWNECMKAEAGSEEDANQASNTEATTKKTNEDPKDPFEQSQGEGDDTADNMPHGNMSMGKVTVAHARALMGDEFGDWASNLNSSSNQMSDNENEYAFTEGEEKTVTLAKAKKLKEIFEKSGRVVSGKNEDRIRNAIDLLTQVIAELEQEDQEEVGEQDKEPAEKSQATVIVKKVIPYSDHGTAPESEAWDGPGEKAKATTDDLKIMCAWYDDTKADDKGSYKLPHHQADGEHKAVWRGVAAAMASLLGSRGGVDIPEGDRKGVYNHLAKHYIEFDKEAPDFKMVEDQVMASLDEEVFAITLEREEKHITRLIKKVLENQKEQKKEKLAHTEKPQTQLDAQALEAKVLSVFESALTKISSISSGGGEK